MKKTRQLFYSLGGAAMMLASALTVADFAEKKSNKGKAHFAELLVGTIGVAVGACLAYTPVLEEKHPVDQSELFDDEQGAQDAKNNISETLGKSVERTPAQTHPLGKIEVDNEASIEDFIIDAE